ncbi:hypothetical protein VLK31_30655 [Variovorax sp. H27-G14]|uniref:hypothetical protein n=1 Tax=Variovorax sp. H27-G14 TaxID=3111914 RepID=UPI0038FD1BF2
MPPPNRFSSCCPTRAPIAVPTPGSTALPMAAPVSAAPVSDSSGSLMVPPIFSGTPTTPSTRSTAISPSSLRLNSFRLPLAVSTPERAFRLLYCSTTPSSVPCVSSVPVSWSSCVRPPRLMPAVVTALTTSSLVSVAGCTVKLVRVCMLRISALRSCAASASAVTVVWPDTLPATEVRRSKACTRVSMSICRGSSSADTRSLPVGSVSSRVTPFHVPPPASMRVRQRSWPDSRSSRRRAGGVRPARSSRAWRGRHSASKLRSPS